MSNRLIPGARVKIQTRTAGCYHNKTGVILHACDAGFQEIPTPEPPALPDWFRVKFDTPASNGGTPVETEIFLPHELTVI